MKDRNDYKKMVKQRERAQILANKMKTEAMDEGALAAANNEGKESNPYKEGHPLNLNLFWIDGWNEEKYSQEQE